MRKPVAIWLAVQVLACGLIALPAAGAERVVLRLRPEPGRIWTTRITYNQVISKGEGEAKEETDQTVAIDYRFTALERTPTGQTPVRVEPRRLVYRRTGGAESEAYDTERPSGPVPEAVKEGVAGINRSFILTIAPDGKVGRIEGIDQDLLQAVMSVYPDHPVAVGDTWKSTARVGGTIPLILDATLKLKGRKAGISLVTVDSIIREKPGPASLELGPFKVGYDIDGTQTGTIEIEERSGWPIRARLEQLFSGRFRVGAGEILSQGLSAPVRGRSSVLLDPL